ncbi:MAG TPA: hypothetical protein VIK30_02280, partial [Polyangia bacterium]
PVPADEPPVPADEPPVPADEPPVPVVPAPPPSGCEVGPELEQPVAMDAATANNKSVRVEISVVFMKSSGKR